ncbi:PaaI family thioesterase [Halalkalicoccus jeotgali]|uniref:Thioesterase superfamily protein n=1 Tax=Halalkalicoccus jeotgali (strain DSM 18796 / CECT 7217 / JCM 14584 / KCTC 4019 / B3) TaxID=795797 RepID=D8JCV4_HALJB|nr:PaaI family thioesterase [Halalkalicoccus jeotgali]ADJ16849.1 thioesterase superfamily protein [Halalkalicoccus jeotgali B3]ELY38715.1 thioesterase superfamily protein [Halalkalicoccus jeotgali B3]
MTGPSKTSSERVLAETGLLSWLGITIVEESEGNAVLRLPHRKELTNPNGDTLHGGVLATLLDNAAGTALRTVLKDPETALYATTEMNLSYLRPATGDLRAEARVRRHGRSLAVIEVDIVSERTPGEWTTVVVGRASYYVDEGE